jgi:polysaccharide pyruvyl transferase WcaK-like protein
MADVSVRDPLACRTASALAGQSVDVIPDPAFMLHPVAPEAARKWLTDRGVPLDGSPLVGVAARRVFPARPRIVPHKIRWRLGSRRMSAATEELVARLAGDLDRIAERRRAYVLLMPSYSAAHEQDVEVSEAIVQRMASSRAQVARVDDPRLYKGITGQLSLMLGGRMHPTILAAAMGTRVVGIGYNQKFQGAFQLLGQSHRVVDIQTVTAQRHPGLGELLEAALDDDPPDPSRARELADRTRNRLADLVAGRGG